MLTCGVAQLGAGLPVGMAAVAAREVPGSGGIEECWCWEWLRSLHEILT